MNTPNKTEFLRLVEMYLDGTANARQASTVEQYFDLFSTEPDILDTLQKNEIREIHDRLKSAIDRRIDQEDKFHPVVSWKYLSVAASILLAATIGIYFYQSRKPQLKQFSKNTKMLADIAPGSNKAILTLANGSKISLTDAHSGEIASQFGTSISKSKDGSLVYDKPGSANVQLAYNSVETPKGGQYQLILTDGTKVWLNAASSLKYPLAFDGKERKVELNGEAYFEVAKNKSMPFRVVTDHQMVEVLGTHFDINSYADEPSTRTSLLEGSVRVTNLESNTKVVIKPGQQSMVNSGSSPAISVKNIDTDEAVAWKNGYFMFDEEPLESILRKISRWYDVDIQYKGLGAKNNLYFSGTLSRYSNVSKVLKKLELTESVHFKVEGRTIIVMP
jgi:transmembrane sensor